MMCILQDSQLSATQTVWTWRIVSIVFDTLRKDADIPKNVAILFLFASFAQIYGRQHLRSVLSTTFESVQQSSTSGMYRKNCKIGTLCRWIMWGWRAHSLKGRSNFASARFYCVGLRPAALVKRTFSYVVIGSIYNKKWPEEKNCCGLQLTQAAQVGFPAAQLYYQHRISWRS